VSPHADHVPPQTGIEPDGRAAQHPLSFRFLAPDLERRYQLHAGAESHSGLRVITGASALLWLAAAFLVPVDMGISRDVATPISMAMSAISAAFFLASGRARTLDQQHALATVLTAGNGLVILWLASAGGVLPGYGVSAVLLLFAYGFVSRTRFIYAALRSVVIGIGFVVAAATYHRPGSLLIDAFILGAAIFGTLLALRLLEQSRRRVFVQDLVIAEQSAELAAEKEEAERLLLNILPERISTRLRDGEHTIADKYPAVSVLFADIVGFTPLVARLSPAEMIELLGGLFASFDELTGERGLEKIKTIGDAYMVAAGLPEPMEDHAERAVDLGLAMIEAATRVGPLLRGGGCVLRVGVHSGPVVAGVIGRRKFAFDVWGDTVNVASRLESQGVPNRVHISHATWLLVRDRFDAEPQGPLRLRGLGAIQTYAVTGRRVPRTVEQPDAAAIAAVLPQRVAAADIGSAAV
jgi:adenylate cyclase